MKIKKRIRKIIHNIQYAGKMAPAFFMFVYYNVMPVYASTSTDVTKPIDNLKGLLIDLVSAIGVCIIVWGGFEMGNAMQTRDGSAKSDALSRIAGGAIMTVISQVVNIIMS